MIFHPFVNNILLDNKGGIRRENKGKKKPLKTIFCNFFSSPFLHLTLLVVSTMLSSKIPRILIFIFFELYFRFLFVCIFL